MKTFHAWPMVKALNKPLPQFWDVEKEKALNELCQKEAIKPEVSKRCSANMNTPNVYLAVKMSKTYQLRPKISERKTLMNTLVLKTRNFIEKFYRGL
jgi:type I restriction enzyme R subunit